MLKCTSALNLNDRWAYTCILKSAQYIKAETNDLMAIELIHCGYQARIKEFSSGWGGGQPFANI